MKTFDLSLYLVTDRSLAAGRSLTEIVRQAVRGGVTMVQLREKNCSTQEFIEQATALKQVLQGTGVPLIINDRVDVALAVDADGVHIGQSDMPYKEVRRLMGKDKIIGLSVESMQDIDVANSLDVDYIGISPLFATPTKQDTARPFGLDGTREAVHLSRHPAVAIGGIHADNVEAVRATGVQGVAVVSEIISAEDPYLAAKGMRTGTTTTTTTTTTTITETKAQSPSAKYKRVLTIAGSDSGGGAGVQADIKTISALGCYAASAITAVTVQNTLGVQSVEAISIPTITGQIRAVIDDIGVDAVKIGMLHSSEVVKAVADTLREYKIKNIVLDPVMVSTSGHRLIEEDAIAALMTELMPLARVITPNIPEAEILLGRPLTCQADLPDAAKDLANKCQTSVLLKAGHLKEDQLVDIFYDYEESRLYQFPSQRVYSRNTHGTGCTLSSAVASYLARGYQLPQAVEQGKQYITQAIDAGVQYEIGHGFGPVHHFFGLELLR
ncbi:MAG: bifunctional hydroxymethylpyrimidine kinase/phosphomethylpyrimidine kinase [Bacteroidales bacterium]|nr:bifunctional hydroxymethylpyrimidine kinase/phosphomethylpyrimidine kinase [Candidatus Colicola coprequi]